MKLTAVTSIRRLSQNAGFLIAGPFAAVVVLGSLFLYVRDQRHVTEELKGKARATAEILAAAAAAAPATEKDTLISVAKSSPEVTYAVLMDPTGRLLTPLPNGVERGTRQTLWEHNEMWHALAPVSGSTGFGFVQVGVAQPPSRDPFAFFLGMGGALVLVAAGVGFVLSQQYDRVFSGVRGSTLNGAHAIHEIVSDLSRSIERILTATNKQSLVLTEARATAQEVADAVSSNVERATALIAGTELAQTASREGLTSLQTAAEAMGSVREQMSTILGTIRALGEKAAAIGDIAATVALLAERSNLLALNAAIEAARTDVHGRGFAVVAQEMRQLADGSGQSTAQVKVLLSQIQGAIGKAVSDAPLSKRSVDEAVVLTEKTGTSIGRFAEVTQQVMSSCTEIGQTAERQREAIGRMLEGLNQAVDVGAAHTGSAAKMEELTLALRDLSQRVLALTERI